MRHRDGAGRGSPPVDRRFAGNGGPVEHRRRGRSQVVKATGKLAVLLIKVERKGARTRVLRLRDSLALGLLEPGRMPISLPLA